MKKLCIIICCLAMILCFGACSVSSKQNIGNVGNADDVGNVEDIETEDEFFLSYLPSEPKVKGSTLYINGLLSNGSDKYDIVDLSSIEIAVTDKSGNVQEYITLNTQFAENCVIPPYGTVEYNFTCDTSDLTVQSVWDLRFEVIGEYYYIECQGDSCEYCGGRKQNTYIPNQGSDSEYSEIECSNCKGSGVCSECGGSGKNDYGGVLSSYGCTLCDKTGRCHKCKGSGSIKVY